MGFYVVALPVAVSLLGALLVLGTLWLIPVNYRESLSQHIMRSRRTVVQGMILLSLACLSLWCWSVIIDVSWLLRLALFMTGASYLVTGLAPYGLSSRHDKLHDVAAWSGLITMFGANILLAYEFGGVVGVVAIAGATVQLSVVGLFAATKPERRTFVLVGQVVYLAAFLASIVSAGIVYA